MIQYRDGAADYTRVLTSQESLVAQQDNYSAARGNIARSLIAAYKALGGGWEIPQQRDVVPEAIKKQMRERTNWGGLLDAESMEDDNLNKVSW